VNFLSEKLIASDIMINYSTYFAIVIYYVLSFITVYRYTHTHRHLYY